jgi:chromosome partitioning protein
MKTIALISRKGGAGKSTLAISLGVAAQQAGEKVFMLDLDPQGSLLGWGKTRKADYPGVDVTDATDLAEVLAALARAGHTLVILDTAGVDGPSTTAAMKVADVCLVPAQPTTFDVRAARETRDTLVVLGRSFLFVLNRCPPTKSGSRSLDGAGALKLMGDVASPSIANRVDYQDALVVGLGVTELRPDSKAAIEVRELWQFIKKNQLTEGVIDGHLAQG